uniref:Sulfotransferase domain-containing protein n=1 Tax=Octactis speculum TaxID=3111310 RepID=A0A7S2H7V9_9STRA|mmetsp:Transcript_62183/g.85465  ORF Transcript_62183/g.85465 Transcript_62183/m.85465 type:complete len:416 (+) Transcript_62183:183-1430(+)
MKRGEKKKGANGICILCGICAVITFINIRFHSNHTPSVTMDHETVLDTANDAIQIQENPVRLQIPHNISRPPPVVNIPPVPKNGVPSHWTPVSVGSGSDPTINLCKLDYDSYWRNPNNLPMFKDLVGKSKCSGKNSKSAKLSVLKKEMEADPDGTLQPTGFVFHESRCGSTLVADMLGSQAHHLVFSESAPPSSIASRGPNAHRVLRDVMLLMCRSSYHTRCFFKFQSINAPRIKTYLAAFPDVPWTFVFREPVQVMMSHLKGSGSHAGAVCMRSRRSPTAKHKQIIAELGKGSSSVSAEEFCAVHLAYLSESAYEAFTSTSTGMLLNYEDLPSILPSKVVGDHFRVPLDAEGQTRMLNVAKIYSKGRKGSPKKGEFTGDSLKKENTASDAVKNAAAQFLYPSYRKLAAASVKAH